MKLKNNYLKIISVLVVLATLFLPPLILKLDAQESSSSNNGISVTPVKIQRNYKGNDTDNISFTLLNNEDTETTLSVTVKSFKLINNNQDIVFDESLEQTVLNWLKNFKNSIILKPKERSEYNLELNITPDSNPGGYLFGIFFETQGDSKGDSNSEAFIKQSIGVPFIINVAGVKGISYGEVSLDTFDVGYNFISNSISYSILILNNSNQIITPSGVFTLTKNTGVGPDTIKSNFNQSGLIINSFSLRSFTREIPFNQFVLGKYDVSFDFLYGLENNVFSQKTSVIIVPLWLIAGVIIVIILAVRKLRNKKNDK